MALLNILHYPDDRLRNVARPVVQVDDEVRRLVDDMLETMYDANGIGLAAIQVDVPQRVVVLDISEERDDPRVFINPEVVARDGVERMQEGCLSVPGYYDWVERAEQIRVRALDRDGRTFRMDADGLLAVCIQHEIDHLDGKLFVDYLSELKRKRLRKKLIKAERQGQLPERSATPVI
ncbi:MAG TPA: peptide deformylase [Gammaproteobacteria bacterium]|nr:peptide deformylase [Gammaproteobacteria bacterium]